MNSWANDASIKLDKNGYTGGNWALNSGVFFAGATGAMAAAGAGGNDMYYWNYTGSRYVASGSGCANGYSLSALAGKEAAKYATEL